MDFCTYSNGQLRGIFGQDRNRVSISKRPTYETANKEDGQLRGIPVLLSMQQFRAVENKKKNIYFWLQNIIVSGQLFGKI